MQIELGSDFPSPKRVSIIQLEAVALSKPSRQDGIKAFHDTSSWDILLDPKQSMLSVRLASVRSISRAFASKFFGGKGKAAVQRLEVLATRTMTMN